MSRGGRHGWERPEAAIAAHRMSTEASRTLAAMLCIPARRREGGREGDEREGGRESGREGRIEGEREGEGKWECR